jgi:hypothetical protein
VIVDFSDPASIAAWVRVAPERHWPQLKAMVKLQPRWRGPTRQASAILRGEAA